MWPSRKCRARRTAVNAATVGPYDTLGQFTAKHVSTSLALLPVAVVANFIGVWLVRTLPSAVCFRITYVLLFVLGSTLLYQGVSHLIQGQP